MIDDEVLCAATGCATNATTVPVATSIGSKSCYREYYSVRCCAICHFIEL